MDVFGTKISEDRKSFKKIRKMKAFKVNNDITIYKEDCIKTLKGMDDDSVSCFVSDPPYHLKSSNNSKRGFMGRHWDGGDVAFSLELWQEALRVLKPGGYVLAFGSPRTYHKMTCAIEMAGFEIKDSIMWLYGQGFPKCHEISKAIDKKYGAKRKVVGTKSSGLGSGKNHAFSGTGDNTKTKKEVDVTIPASALASYWQGWDTNLKPSHEPIVVARKPLEKGMTIAQNVLTWGTGAMNIGACKAVSSQNASTDSNNKKELQRHPANTIISEEVAIELDK